MSKNRRQGWGSRAARQERREHAALGRTREWQQERQAFYRGVWQRQLDALRTLDDDRYKFVRGMALATALGTGRGSTQHAIPPGLAAHLDRARAGASFVTPPPQPTNPVVARRLFPATAKEYTGKLAAARLWLAQERPDHSLVFELVGWQTFSENDLARAFDDSPRSGWSQQSINVRKVEACDLVRRRVLEPNGGVCGQEQEAS